MLTIDQMIMYDIMGIVMLVVGVIAFVLAVLFIMSEKKVDVSSLLCVFIGIMFIGFWAFTVMSANVTTAIITPCSISDGYIADTNDNIYTAEPKIMLKLHVNQTRDVVIMTKLTIETPEIVNVNGTVCLDVGVGC